MLKKLGEEKLTLQLRQHFAQAAEDLAARWREGPQPDGEELLAAMFGSLASRAMDDAETFRVRLLLHRLPAPGAAGGALLLSLCEPELRFQKAVLFSPRASLNAAATEEGNLFETSGIRSEAAALLAVSQSACFAAFSPQGIHVISAASVLGDAVEDPCLLKNFYYLNIADFAAGLFFKCFVGDARPDFISRLQEGGVCRTLLEVRISVLPAVSQPALF